MLEQLELELRGGGFVMSRNLILTRPELLKYLHFVSHLIKTIVPVVLINFDIQGEIKSYLRFEAEVGCGELDSPNV